MKKYTRIWVNMLSNFDIRIRFTQFVSKLSHFLQSFCSDYYLFGNVFLSSDFVFEVGGDVWDGQSESHHCHRQDILKHDYKQESGKPNVPKLWIVLIGIFLPGTCFKIRISAHRGHWGIQHAGIERLGIFQKLIIGRTYNCLETGSRSLMSK